MYHENGVVHRKSLSLWAPSMGEKRYPHGLYNTYIFIDIILIYTWLVRHCSNLTYPCCTQGKGTCNIVATPTPHLSMDLELVTRPRSQCRSPTPTSSESCKCIGKTAQKTALSMDTHTILLDSWILINLSLLSGTSQGLSVASILKNTWLTCESSSGTKTVFLEWLVLGLGCNRSMEWEE